MVFKRTKTSEHLSEAVVREIVDEMLRTALSEQARDLEEHLKNIHERIQKLEKRGK
jgi:rubrerythrin|tara:strand:+ start:351 stop:518 length:168 start_codon:yes stop_codon:yes gene_type:complete